MKFELVDVAFVEVLLGDLDNDGVVDLAVGALGDDDGSSTDVNANRGAVYVLFLNTDGTVKDHQKISSTQGGLTGPLSDADYWGNTVASLGDFDGDGLCDLAATSITWAMQGNAGYVFLYQGQAPEGLFLGGLSAAPRAWLTSARRGPRVSFGLIFNVSRLT